MEKIADGCKSIAWIHEIKFSPSGAILAAGSHDKRMYAYSVPEITTADLAAQDTTEWNRCLTKTRFEFNKHSSAVLHFDFSLDGKYFQSNCQASELLFGTLPDGRHETSASKLADYNNQLDDSEEGKLWASQTCKLGWPVRKYSPFLANSSKSSTCVQLLMTMITV